jgi:hypothetical protein
MVQTGLVEFQERLVLEELVEYRVLAELLALRAIQEPAELVELVG